MNNKTLPIITIAGFLGSGKTTMLNYILKHSEGRRIAVIVNDFGETNIDSMLIAGKTDEKIELSNGCICCSMGDNGLDDTLEAILKQSNAIDAIIIEASGIAEPSEVKRMVLTSKNKKISFGGLVYIIDAQNYGGTKKRYPNIVDHIKAADCIVLNKSSAISANQESYLKNDLKKINAQTPVVATIFGEIDPELLFDIELKKDQQLSLAHARDGHSTHMHSRFSSLSFESSDPLGPAKFIEFIKKPLKGVYRAKGFAYFGMKGLEQKLIVQKVGNRLEFLLEGWKEGESLKTELVFIGVDIDKEEIEKQLAECIDKTPDNISSGEMLDVRSYM